MTEALSKTGEYHLPPDRLSVRRKLFSTRPDWFLVLLLLAVSFPADVWEWFSIPRMPTSSEWYLLAFIAFISVFNPLTLFKRTPVVELDKNGLVFPDKYEQQVPWDAVTGVRQNGNHVLIDIAGGQRFDRMRTGLYRLFPEQARYKANDVQIVDPNRTTVTAAVLIDYISRHMPAQAGSQA